MQLPAGSGVVAALGMILSGASCAGGQQQDPAPMQASGPPGADLGPPLNDVQIQCRSEKLSKIGLLDSALGPSCEKRTMSLTLSTFDAGSLAGYIEAESHARVQTLLCLCNATDCTEENLARAIAAAQDMADNLRQAEYVGVSAVTDSMANHNCLDASIGGRIFKEGFMCGYVAGSHSSILRSQMKSDFAAVITDDPDRARAEALACWASFTGADTSE